MFQHKLQTEFFVFYNIKNQSRRSQLWDSQNMQKIIWRFFWSVLETEKQGIQNPK